jgi:solute:Na+ symporter, SSS family
LLHVIAGLQIVDWIVIVGYFSVLVSIGLWSRKFIHSTDDYFLGGRRFGKLLVSFSSWGAITNADSPVATASKAFQVGFSGIWLTLFWTILSPFVWIKTVWFRRLRYVTSADFLEARYHDPKLAAAYAVFGICFFMAFVSAGLSAAGKTVEALTPIPSGQFAPQASTMLSALARETSAKTTPEPDLLREVDRIITSDASYATDPESGGILERSELSAPQLMTVYRSRELSRLKLSPTLTPENRARFNALSAERPRSAFSHLPMVVTVPLMCLMVLVYGIAGGLSAAVLTDFLQGWVMIVMSFILIPFGLQAVGGFSGLHQAVPAHLFDMFTSAAASEFTWPVILFGVVPINIFVAMASPASMGNANFAKNEFDSQVGGFVGTVIKRLSTIGWALTGVLCMALFAGQLTDPDHVWGYATQQLLGPLGFGLVGLMIAALLATIMSSADSYMVASSALFTHNIYKAFWPQELRHTVVDGESLASIAGIHSSDRHAVTPESILRRNSLSSTTLKAGQSLLVPEEHSENRYLQFGRIGSAVMIIGACAIALWWQDVVQQFKLIWTMPSIFAALFWLGLFWRRATRTAAWVTFVFCCLSFKILPLVLANTGVDAEAFPLLGARTLPFEKIYHDTPASELYVRECHNRLAEWERPVADLGERLAASTGAEHRRLQNELSALQSADPRKRIVITVDGERQEIDSFAAQVGDRVSIVDRTAGRPIFLDKGGLHVELLLIHLLRPLARPINEGDGTVRYEGTITTSMHELLKYPLQIVVPLFLMILISLLTRPLAYDALNPVYARLHTPVVPLDPMADAEAIQRAIEDPRRIEDDKFLLWWKLPERCNWEFSSWERKDWLGLLVVLGIVCAIITLAYGVTRIGA